MNVLSLTCNHCGAPLQVPEETRFLTCQFCSSQLEVQHAGNAVYTQVLQAIDQRTAAMAKDIDEIKRHNELEQLDRDWERERENYLVRGKDGHTSIPTTAGSLVGMTIGVIFSIFWIGLTASAGAPGFLQFFGVAALVLVVFGSLNNCRKALKYRSREADYEQRRQALRRS